MPNAKCPLFLLIFHQILVHKSKFFNGKTLKYDTVCREFVSPMSMIERFNFGISYVGVPLAKTLFRRVSPQYSVNPMKRSLFLLVTGVPWILNTLVNIPNLALASPKK